VLNTTLLKRTQLTQIRHEPYYKQHRLYAEIATDITTRNLESKDTFIIGQHKKYKQWATCLYHQYLVFSSATCVLGISLYDNKVCQLLTKCIRFSPVHNLPLLHSDYMLNAGVFYYKIECYTHTVKIGNKNEIFSKRMVPIWGA
jgi:hypothetical protein